MSLDQIGAYRQKYTAYIYKYQTETYIYWAFSKLWNDVGFSFIRDALHAEFVDHFSFVKGNGKENVLKRPITHAYPALFINRRR